MEVSDQQHVDSGRALTHGGPDIRPDVEVDSDAELDAVSELDEERLRAIEIIASLDDDGSFAASLDRLRAKIPEIVNAAMHGVHHYHQPPSQQNIPFSSSPDVWRVVKHTTLVWGPARRRTPVTIRSRIHQQRHTGISTEIFRIEPISGFDLLAFNTDEPLDIRCGAYFARAQWRKIEATSLFCIETSAPASHGIRPQLYKGPIEIITPILALGGLLESPIAPEVPFAVVEPKFSAGLPRGMEHST